MAKHVAAIISNTAYKCKNSSVKMIQHVPTSEITTCIWTPLLEHLQGIQPPCKAPGRWAPSQVAGPFCPLLAAWTSEKLRRRWWRQSPSPKPHLWAETAGRSDFWILYAFMHSNMWDIETMVELMPLWKVEVKWGESMDFEIESVQNSLRCHEKSPLGITVTSDGSRDRSYQLIQHGILPA